MLKLQVIQPGLGLRAASNFSVKAMALLNMTGLPYEIKVQTPSKGPRGKLPVLIDGNQVIPDSTHIQSHLEDKFGYDFDAGLSERDKADAEAYRKLVEEHLYWAALYIRYFVYPEITRDGIFGSIPVPFRNIVFAMIKRMVRKSLHGHGLGRHTKDQIMELGVSDVNAVAARIGTAPFFFGNKPTSIDAAVYPMLQSIAVPAMDGPLRRSVTSNQNLMSYIERCEVTFFGPTPFRAEGRG